MQTTVKNNVEASALLHAVGRVQGVGYRKFTQMTAQGLSLAGRVRNLPDGRVEVEVTGPRAKITALVHALEEGPERASVRLVEIQWCERRKPVDQFLIDF